MLSETIDYHKECIHDGFMWTLILKIWINEFD